MDVLLVNHAEVRELLSMSECIDVMTRTFETLGHGNVVQPLRPVMWLPEKIGALGMMPGYLGNSGLAGIKVISVFPGNLSTQYESHQGCVLLFETQHGRLLGVVDAGEITGIRTAAASAVATRALARPDAGDLTILGSGTQARMHLQAMLQVRNIRRIRAWSPTLEHLRQWAEQAARVHDVQVEIADNPAAAVEGADLICTATSAREPILNGDWIAPGAHINAVGACIPVARELDSKAVLQSRLIVDRRESAQNEAGDFIIPKVEGVLGEDHIRAELGEVLIGKHPGRETAEEITLFKSLGLAVEDVAAAHYVYEKAKTQGLGTHVEMGGLRGASD